jgi:hypothetical protein
MSKTIINRDELESMITAELRCNECCNGLATVSVVRLESDRIDGNWEIKGFVSLDRSSQFVSPDCQRLAIGAQQRLRKQYDVAWPAASTR